MADRNFERALRSAARRGRPAGVCPDAATIAAYVDRSLSAEEHAAVQAHLADCMACTEHLALVAAIDVPEDTTVPTPAFDFGALIRKWGWLVPAMTAVFVAAVWIRSDQRQPVASLPTPQAASPAPPEQKAALPAEARRNDEAPADRLSQLARAEDAKTRRDTAAVGSRLKAAPLRRAEPPPSMTDAASPPSQPVQEAQSQAAKMLAEDTSANKTDKEEAQRAAAAVASPAPAPPPPPPSAPSAALEVADAREGAVAKAPAAAAAGGSALGRMRKVARQESAAAGFAPALVRTVSGRIDRSIDGGQSWITEHVGVTDRVQVTHCPIATACWLGTDSGTLFVRRSDGQWTRRVTPAPASPVKRIVAVDNDQATVELADGRRFVTADAGVTWTVPPPAER